MKMFNRTSLSAVCFYGAYFLAASAGVSHAASITWGPATNISGDSDVTTAGSLVVAFNMGSTSPSNVSPATVNGVTFASFVTSTTPTMVGNVTLTRPSGTFQSNTSFGSTLTPFSSLSSSYQALLQSGDGSFGDMTLAIGGLTVGQTYLFQWWSNDSGLLGPTHANYTTNAKASGTSSIRGLNDNTSGATGTPGGLGQFAIGTFVADSATETIVFSGTADFPLINAFQVRAVPLPPAVWAGLGMLAGLGGMRWWRRRARKV
jgi:hypothetical protein